MSSEFGSELAVYKDRYIANTRLQIQVSKNLYDGSYTPLVGVMGEKAQAIDIVGASEPIFDHPDKADTPTEDNKHEGVWVAPRKISVPGKWVTDEAKLKTMVDYSGAYVQSHALTILRGQNALIRDAIFGARLVKRANNSLPIPDPFDFGIRSVAVNYVYSGAATNSGMTVQKFIKALELLGITDLDLDAENIFCAMTMRQNTDLLQTIQVTSKDYMDRAVLANDKYVRSFMGVKIIIDNRLPVNPAASSQRRCPFWAKSGLHFGAAVEYSGEIDRVPTRQNQILIQGRGWYAATRSEDERVVNVECLEA